MGNENLRCSCLRSDFTRNEYELSANRIPRIITSNKIGQSFGLNVPSLYMSIAENENSSISNDNIEFNRKLMKNIKKIIKIQCIFRGYIFRKKLRIFGIILSKEELDKLNKNIKDFLKCRHKPNTCLKFDFDLNVEEGWKKYYDEEDNEIEKMNENVNNKVLLFCLGYFSNFSKIPSLYTGYVDTKFKLNGSGRLIFQNGAWYEGVFNEGKLHGWGRYADKIGNIYEGLFIHGILTGKGIEMFPDDNGNQIIYEGEFKKFIKEGFGIENCKEYIYEGNFKDNVKHGQGKLKYKNTSDIYEGEFTNGTITGYGYYTWDNKHSYLGDFLEGKMHGTGIYKWPDGSEYRGEYKENVKEGEGEFKWKDGRLYQGPFVGGKPHGKGRLIVKNIVIEGIFNNGKFEGNLKEILKKKKRESKNYNNNEGETDSSLNININ